jgi:ketosteroid isomerase-like protein
MRALAVIVTVLFAMFCFSQADDHAADRAYIEKSEAQWAEVTATRDCSVLERILADDFVGVDVDGSRYTKAADLKECKTAPSKFEFNHLNKVDVRFFGDTAIAQGSESWKLKNGKTGTFFWTDTWLKRNGQWQIVAAEDLMPVASPFQ